MIAQILALLTALAIVVPAEVEHLQDALRHRWSDWLMGINVDTTLPWLLMVLLPYFWFVRRPFWTPTGQWWNKLTTWWSDGSQSARATAVSAVVSTDQEQSRTADTAVAFGRRGTLIAVLLIAATSVFASHRVASHRVGDREQYRFGDLPSAYHDEYSYLFQADTYLAGRWSFPSHPKAARLFDQMHVLNEGRFASRYFPATGLFVAPWLWLGWPILGHWLVGAATGVLVFGIGRELSSNGTGFVAGMLTALSPGMALFGNLVLAHHPTLLGLFFFAWSFVRWQRTGRVRDIAFAVVGLSWAMLCRPMTAAGFSLPFGVAFALKLWRLLGLQARSTSRGRGSSVPRWRFGLVWSPLLAMLLPLVAGFVVLGIQNHAITGTVMTSPYQLFTDIYTPRHVYGFNNVVRGEQHLGPRVLDNYDRWAVNLTPALAVENTKNRLLASWQWTVGLVPLLAATVVFVLTGSSRDRRWWLIFAAIVSLFAVHVPYWFVGMFDWHYVLETGPLWCLVLAAASDTLGRAWLATARPRMVVWWSAIVFSAVAVSLFEFAPLWYPSKLELAVENVAFSRLRYQAFNELVQREVRDRPALLLIEADPADRHIDYVVNEPSLSASVLRGRFPVADWPLERIAAEFPDRALYLFLAKTGELRLLTRRELQNAK